MTTPARPYPVALHGAYHTDNFGDVLLMLIYRRWLHESSAAVEVRMPFVPEATAPHFDPGPARGFGALRDVATFVYAGGGYFGEPPTGARRWGLRLAARHLLPGFVLAHAGRDLVISGVGAGPLSLPLARRMLAAIVVRARLITVRDDASRDLLVELGAAPDEVRVTADAALTLRPESLPRAAVDHVGAWLARAPQAPRLGVHLARPAAGGGGYRVLLDDVVAFAEARPEVRLVPLSDQRGASGQAAAIEELTSRLPGRCDPYPYDDPWRLCALLDRLTMVVTTKLHVGIVAAALGTPVLSYPRHPKVGRFYAQIGAPDATQPQASLRPGQPLEHLRGRFGRAEGAVPVPASVRAAADANRSLLQDHLRERIARAR